MTQWMLAISSLVPLPSQNPVCTSGISQFTYCWSLKDFEHYFASMWNEHHCAIVWTFFDLAFLWDWASLVAQLVKNLPAMQETRVWSLGWKDPLEKGKATYSSILENSMDCRVHGVAKSQTWLSAFSLPVEQEKNVHPSINQWDLSKGFQGVRSGIEPVKDTHKPFNSLSPCLSLSHTRASESSQSSE